MGVKTPRTAKKGRRNSTAGTPTQPPSTGMWTRSKSKRLSLDQDPPPNTNDVEETALVVSTTNGSNDKKRSASKVAPAQASLKSSDESPLQELQNSPSVGPSQSKKARKADAPSNDGQQGLTFPSPSNNPRDDLKHAYRKLEDQYIQLQQNLCTSQEKAKDLEQENHLLVGHLHQADKRSDQMMSTINNMQSKLDTMAAAAPSNPNKTPPRAPRSGTKLSGSGTKLTFSPHNKRVEYDKNEPSSAVKEKTPTSVPMVGAPENVFPATTTSPVDPASTMHSCAIM